jgi:hypothetical protein
MGTQAVTDGLVYKTFRYQDSQVHILKIDLSLHSMRPVMDKEEFPLNSGHAQTKAVESGALACGPGGFNITLYHGWGIQDQPQHALVIDEEIWTTGIGNGGFGVLCGDGWIKTQRNRIQVHVWKPDGSVIEVEHVNRGHEDEVVAFTPRGGTNEYPRYRGKHFVSFETSTGLVRQVGETPPLVWPKYTVLESTYDLGLAVGDVIKWKQNLGAEGVRHVMSGYPQVVQDGENIVASYEFDPQGSNGPDNWFIRRNPRTAIGHDETGTTAYMVFVEGRLPNSYRPTATKERGVRLMALGEICENQGIWAATDMDGGGSAFQWTKDEGMNPGCYNASGTIAGQRPAHFSASVF